MIKIERNAETGILEAFIPAKLLRIPAATLTLDNEKATPYGRAQALVTYPDGSTDTIAPIMWGASIDKELFREGDDIIVRTQLEGDYAGQGIVQLGGATGVDLAKFAFDLSGFAKAAPAVAAKV